MAGGLLELGDAGTVKISVACLYPWFHSPVDFKMLSVFLFVHVGEGLWRLSFAHSGRFARLSSGTSLLWKTQSFEASALSLVNWNLPWWHAIWRCSFVAVSVREVPEGSWRAPFVHLLQQACVSCRVAQRVRFSPWAAQSSLRRVARFLAEAQLLCLQCHYKATHLKQAPLYKWLDSVFIQVWGTYRSSLKFSDISLSAFYEGKHVSLYS